MLDELALRQLGDSIDFSHPLSIGAFRAAQFVCSFVLFVHLFDRLNSAQCPTFCKAVSAAQSKSEVVPFLEQVGSTWTDDRACKLLLLEIGLKRAGGLSVASDRNALVETLSIDTLQRTLPGTSRH